MAEEEYAREKTWTIGNGQSALTLKMSVSRQINLRPHISFRISGLLHPYLEGNDRDLHYMGDATKNPALLPAARLLMQKIDDILHTIPQSKKYILMDDKQDDPLYVVQGADSLSTSVEIKKKWEFPSFYIKNKKIDALVDALEMEVDKALPDVQQEVEKHKTLQPDPNASDAEKDEVLKKVLRAHHKATNELEDESQARGDGSQWVEMTNRLKRRDDPNQGKHRWN